MSTLTQHRVAELMDQPAVDPIELRRGLADLRSVNRWLGGTRTALDQLVPMLLGTRDREVTVLDVATGSGDIPLALARWAREARRRVRVLASDSHAATVEAARLRAVGDANVEVVQADALALPFPDNHVDFSMCHTALHHFDREEAIVVLRELARVARRGVLVTDLRRSRPALLGARLLAATVWRNHPVTRHDGPSSVRAAYTAGELRELAIEAGLEDARVSTHPVFRLSLVMTFAEEGM